MYVIKCQKCGATAHAHGEDDYETNSFSIDDTNPIEWNDGDANCDHEEFDVIEYLYDDD